MASLRRAGRQAALQITHTASAILDTAYQRPERTESRKRDYRRGADQEHHYSSVLPMGSTATMTNFRTINLVNMVVVSAVSATVLLGLLAAKHF